MQASIILKSLIFIFFAICGRGLSHHSLARDAIRSILLRHFTNRSDVVEFISFGVKNGHSEIFVNEILREKKDSIVTRISSNGATKKRLNTQRFLHLIRQKITRNQPRT